MNELYRSGKLKRIDLVLNDVKAGDGYGYVLVATGRVEAMYDPKSELYDVAPMPVILA